MEGRFLLNTGEVESLQALELCCKKLVRTFCMSDLLPMDLLRVECELGIVLAPHGDTEA